MKKRNKKSSKFNFLHALIGFIVGALFGIVMVVYLDGVFEEYGFLLSLAFKLMVLVLAYYLQTIIHELGHLVAGLLSGYKFGSFRIGSIMLVSEDGGLKIKRQKIMGTGGQCLMTPPKMKNGKFPFRFFNMGGVIMNVLSLPLCVLWLQRAIGRPFEMALSVMMFFAGFAIALTNGIPMKLGIINNDGSNTVELSKNEEARIAFHNQFMILDLLRAGTRLRDMPDEYFPMPSEKGMKNSIAASGATVLENRLIDAHKFDEARVLIDRLLTMDSALIGLHKNLLLCDKITLDLIQGRAGDELDRIFAEKGFNSFLKQMRGTSSILRTRYAYELLYKKDEASAQKTLLAFEKAVKSSPYSADVAIEQELVQMITHKVGEC